MSVFDSVRRREISKPIPLAWLNPFFEAFDRCAPPSDIKCESYVNHREVVWRFSRDEEIYEHVIASVSIDQTQSGYFCHDCNRDICVHVTWAAYATSRRELSKLLKIYREYEKIEGKKWLDSATLC